MRRLKTKRIAVLLLSPEIKISTKYRLAQLAGCSAAWAIMLLKKWQQENIVRNLTVQQPMKLLEIIEKIQNPKREAKRYSISNVTELMNWLKTTDFEYAFTTYSAENLLQKYLFPTKIEFYVKATDMDKWHAKLIEKGFYGAGNITVYVDKYDELFHRKKIGNYWIVNTPQLIHDLAKEGGPAKEASDMLKQKLINSMHSEGNTNVSR